MTYFFRTALSFFLLLGLSFVQAQNDVDFTKILQQYDSDKNNMTVEERKLFLKNRFAEANEKNNKVAQSDIYRRFGLLHKEVGELDSALNYFQRAAELEEKLGKPESRASTLNNIASIYYHMGDYASAREYYKEAYNIFKSIPWAKGMADVAINLADASLMDRDTAEADIWSKKSLENRIKSNELADIGYNYEFISRLHLARRALPEAKIVARLASNSYKLAEDNYGLVNAAILAGEIRLASNEIDSAIVFLEPALLQAKELRNKVVVRDAADLLTKVYERKGDPWKSLEYHKTASSYNDSLIDETIANAVIDARNKYDNESLARNVKAKQQQIILLIVLIITLVAIAVLIILNRQKNVKISAKEIELRDHRIEELLKAQELKMVDAMLKGQAEERQRIAMDLHDRLGSMLSTVKLHFSNIEDEVTQLEEKQARSYHVATEILNEACDEVRKISHDLYSGVLGTFGMKTALLKMIQSVEAAKKVSVTFVDNDLDRKIYQPYEVELYRITQELLSNSLKYAEAKEITIQLNKNEWQLVYSYEDDGKGFDAAELEKAEGIGFKNIESRVKKMNGTWKLDTRPGHGMTLIIEIPLL
jgi:two-component system NarL family sensor kinase